MNQKQSILDWFSECQALELDGNRLVVRKDDMVLEAYLRDLDVYGYDAYLEEIALVAKKYTEELTRLIEKIDSMREEEAEHTRARVMARIANAAPFVGHSAILNGYKG